MLRAKKSQQKLTYSFTEDDIALSYILLYAKGFHLYPWLVEVFADSF